MVEMSTPVEARERYYREHPELASYVSRQRWAIARSKPTTEEERRVMEAYEDIRAAAGEIEGEYKPIRGKSAEAKFAAEEFERMREEWTEEEFEKLAGKIERGGQPTEKDLEGLDLAAAERKYKVIHQFFLGKDVEVTKNVDNAAHTICMTRPMQITIKRSDTDKENFTVDAPEKCITFSFLEKKCVLEAEQAATEKTKCAPIERIFACSQQTLSPSQARIFAEIPQRDADECIDKMYKGGAIYDVPHPKGFADKGLGEDLFAMDRNTANTVKAGVPLKYP